MTELAEAYIWKLNGINHVKDGVYVAYAKDSDFDPLVHFWWSKYQGERVLLCLLPGERLEHLERFDFSIAMRLMPQGYIVARIDWEKEYLTMDKHGIWIHTAGEEEKAMWQPCMDDLMATDWQVLRPATLNIKEGDMSDE